MEVLRVLALGKVREDGEDPAAEDKDGTVVEVVK